jgi:regulation of enolase protein 1 (concanavalin A-like superfamily)
MIRLGSHDWIKLAIEHETAGPAQLGCVVTQSGYSDWSMQPWTADIPSVWLRIRRMADVYWAEWSAGGKDWTPLRVVKLLADTGNDDVLAGIYACAPKSAGFIAEFRSLVINPVVV